MAVTRYILLAAIPGLMFCIIPVHGMPFRFSWQLVSIWLAAGAFMCWLSSWWWRVFFALALLQVIRHGPVVTAYLTLVMIGIFLAAAEGFSRLRPAHIFNAMCIAGLLLSLWIVVQAMGILPETFLQVESTGPFNANAASVFLALCLSACFRGGRPGKHIQWWPLAPILTTGLFLCHSTTGMVAALAAATAFFSFRASRAIPRGLIIGTAAAAMMAGLFFLKVDPLQTTLQNSRWQAWKHAAWSLRSEAFGRGLGSFAEEFPLLVSGDRQLQNIRRGADLPDGRHILESNQWFLHAHNEYVQTGFEMGAQAMLVLMAYLTYFFVTAWRRRKVLTAQGRLAAAGMIGLAVSCAGWHTFHIAPLALLGSAWLGIGRREIL